MAERVYPTVNHVTVENVAPATTANEKGSRTWNLPTQSGVKSAVIMRRFPTDEVGNHYHSDVPGKDPELLYLLAGEVLIWFEDLRGHRRTDHVNADDDGPVLIGIPPFILHGMKVLSDSATYVELQVGEYDPSATKDARAFTLMKARLKG